MVKTESQFDTVVDLDNLLRGEYTSGCNCYVEAVVKTGEYAALLLASRGQVSDAGGAVAILDTLGKLKNLFRVPDNVRCMSSEGNLLYLSILNTVHAIDPRSGKEVGRIHDDKMLAGPALSHGGLVAVLSGPDRPREKEFRIYEIKK